MNNMKKLCDIPPGTTITGKWNKQSYHVLRKLGEGANGIVYLADFGGRLVALKISDNYTSIASEMNVLKSFSKVQGSSLGPYLLHGDDWIRNAKSMPFYVMEYIKGEELIQFTKNKGKGWIEVLVLQLLTSLHKMHREGWIFGDLKPENLLVTLPEYKIRCVDVGGTTMIGRSVKEFTEFFDRGYWGLGSRKAEPSYDLFAVAMIMVNVYYPQRFTKKIGQPNQLINLISNTKELNRYKTVLATAIMGKYSYSLQMRTDLLKVVEATERTATRTKVQVKKKVVKKKSSALGETVILLLIVCCLYGLYIYTQVLG